MSSARIAGMLTAFVTSAPSSAAATCSATITPARSCASSRGAALAETFLRADRVVRGDAHPEPERPPRHLLADPPEAEYAERLALQLDPAVAPALPASLLQRGVRLRDVARERDQQADRVLGGGADGRLRCV